MKFTRERLTRWTRKMREHPELQYSSYMSNPEYTKFCCLGLLCLVEELAEKDFGYPKRTLTGHLAEEFGDAGGGFEILGMPTLEYLGKQYDGAAHANDYGVPWSVIADHFDKYYPCSDEVSPL